MYTRTLAALCLPLMMLGCSTASDLRQDMAQVRRLGKIEAADAPTKPRKASPTSSPSTSHARSASISSNPHPKLHPDCPDVSEAAYAAASAPTSGPPAGVDRSRPSITPRDTKLWIEGLEGQVGEMRHQLRESIRRHAACRGEEPRP